MKPRTDFHSTTTRVACSLGEIQQCICIFCDSVFTSQIALSFSVNYYLNRAYFDCKTKLCLIGHGRQGKYIFPKESFFLQGILNDINEQDTPFLVCKHKHMMKSGAPPDKVRVLYCLLPMEFHGFTSRIDF